MSRRFLHVANGSATTTLIQAAGIPGELSIWADPLYEGPVPGDLADSELIGVRARFLAGPSEDADAVEQGIRRWREVIDDVESYDELVLWFEHDLFDQLNLIQLLTWMKTRLPASTIVRLIEIGAFPGRPAFMGLGELAPNDLAGLLGSRAPVAEERYELAARAWTAFRAASPGALEELRRTNTVTMPFLGPALKRFLEEYPWTTDGLSRSERRLLEIASAGEIDLWTAFVRMHEGETAYYITDGSFLALLQGFSWCSPPLIAVTASLAVDRIPDGSVTLTESGRAVLTGNLDRVATYGIDRWFGGVHLTANTIAWRWNDAEQRIVKAEPRT
jgi:hypothetical protein